MGKDALPTKVTHSPSVMEFLELKYSREDWDKDHWYVLLGWKKDGEPVFVDKGQGSNIWNKYYAISNTGGEVHKDVYWWCHESVDGGRMLPPFVKINPKNLWLELEPDYDQKQVSDMKMINQTLDDVKKDISKIQLALQFVDI